MKKLITLLGGAVILGIVGLAAHNGGRDAIADLVTDQKRASQLMTQVGSGNEEALYEIKSQAGTGSPAYALSLAAYLAIDGNYQARDHIILAELKKANSLESLFILQEFAYLYDNQALARLLADSMDKDGDIPAYVYDSMEKISWNNEQLARLSQCYQQLSATYGKPPKLNWRHYVQNGIENLVGREGVCFGFTLDSTQTI